MGAKSSQSARKGQEMSLSHSNIAKLLILAAFTIALAACSSRDPLQPHAAPYTANIASYQKPAGTMSATPQSSAQVALATALKLLGTPYRYGGSDPRGFDCSGLVQYSYRQAGVTLPRTSQDIFRQSQLIKPSHRQPGDLVFFAISKGKISHVGIYSGSNQFIHSPSSGKGVSYASLDNPYWKSRLIGGGRI